MKKMLCNRSERMKQKKKKNSIIISFVLIADRDKE